MPVQTSEAPKTKLIPDLPQGPLTPYRKTATFCWRKMQIFLETEDILLNKHEMWKKLQDDPLFQRSANSSTHDELRKLTTLRANRIRDYDFFNLQRIMENPQRFLSSIGALTMYDASALIKYIIPAQFFNNSVAGLGSKKHSTVLDQIANEDISGCYALTEVAHGTNAKKMRTTATFDVKTQEFILNTPDFEAAKCWVGNLGNSATHATVFAQLYTPDGKCHGLHGFLTPLRDPSTMLSYPGVIIGDMGEKLGLNGVDNGFAIFSNYRIPKDCLLDKNGTVSSEGKYITPIKDPRKRFGASLGSLVAGRMAVVNICSGNLVKAITIAIRYSSVRKQFGPTDDVELPVIEYQLQQWRLFPFLASAYAYTVLALVTSQAFVDFNILAASKCDQELNDYGVELHALMSSAKPLVSWAAQHCAQEAREACGGHGYLKCSGLGMLRNDNDANCTYEGDNNVLVQQTSNWLLTVYKNMHNKFSSPLGSVEFLYKHRKYHCPESVEQLCQIEEILQMYEWLLLRLLEKTKEQLEQNIKQGQDSFTAKNNSQVFYARNLSLAYIEHYVVLICQKKINEADPEYAREVAVFKRLMSLYGLHHLQRHLSDFYEGGFATGPTLSVLMKDAILQLCSELKPDAVSLADAIAPPDFILNSAIGKSDGEVYKNLQSAFFQTRAVMERPQWWKELTKKFRSRL
ncbi:UNVERIFIED_CONTAM: hypothetical protein PYX00_005324 [Menopon gallinae]|uniref:Acyl-coenzyme A oxidase n=1 Tax=Menopon gallinae TaxID=328185 RepID=A0AAW2HQW1_9NEOP